MATELADAAIEIDIFPWQFNFHKRVSFFWQVFNCLISSIDVYSGGLKCGLSNWFWQQFIFSPPFVGKLAKHFCKDGSVLP